MIGHTTRKLRGADMKRIIRLPEVMSNTGLKRSTIYKLMAMKSFPIQVSLGAKSVGWVESDIEEWIQTRIAQSHPRLDVMSHTERTYANGQ